MKDYIVEKRLNRLTLERITVETYLKKKHAKSTLHA